MQYLKLANGQILNDSRAGAYDGNLWLYLAKLELQKVVAIVTNPEVIREIEFHYGALYSVYTRFTTVKTIHIQPGGSIRVLLADGEVAKEDAIYERALAGNGSDELSSDRGSES